MDTCIYCGVRVDSTKGDGDHVLSVQLGEFRNDERFRQICPDCNSKIGRSEQQFLACGPEAFFRRLVNPKVPSKRQRGKSQIKWAMGAPSPESTIDHGDHRELVKRSDDNPKNAYPIDQMVIHDDQENEYFIKLFSGMSAEQLKDRIKKNGINKIDKTWLHCDLEYCSEFQQLMKEMCPKSELHELPGREAGTTQVKSCTMFTVNDHYFRAVAKIAFHYYLKGGGRLAPPGLYLLKTRPFVAMGDVGFDNWAGNGSLFQESAEE